MQPVAVQDVAHCFAESLNRTETIGKTLDLGGPKSYSWKELYTVCKQTIPGAKKWKPMVGQPVFIAKMLAGTIMKTPLVPANLKFNHGQVQMSQEDSVCDHHIVERTFDMRMRDFEEELASYSGRIP